jgi:hypothetical protein
MPVGHERQAPRALRDCRELLAGPVVVGAEDVHGAVY